MTLYNYFDNNIFSKLKLKAYSATRKRAHLNLHSSYNEPIQKTVIALAKGTYIPPHYHRHEHQKELFVVLSGTIKVIFFCENGSVYEILTLSTGEIAEVLPFAIHTVVCVSSDALILEVKSGPFIAADSKESLDWVVPENSEKSSEYLQWLETVEVE